MPTLHIEYGTFITDPRVTGEVIHFNDLDYKKTTVADLKNLIAARLRLSPTSFDACHMAGILQDEKTLFQCEFEENDVVHIFRKLDIVEPYPAMRPFTLEKTTETLCLLEKYCRNDSFLISLKTVLTKQMNLVFKSTPGLNRDSIAVAILRDYTLLTKLSSNSAELIHKEHPHLASALRTIIDMVAMIEFNKDYVWPVSGHQQIIYQECAPFSTTGIRVVRGRAGKARLELIRGPQEKAGTSEFSAPSIDDGKGVSTASNTSPIPTNSTDATLLPIESLLGAAVLTERLDTLRQMGFTNELINWQALQLGNGDLSKALILLRCISLTNA